VRVLAGSKPLVTVTIIVPGLNSNASSRSTVAPTPFIETAETTTSAPVITDSRLKELLRDHKLTRDPFLPPRFASAEPQAPPPNIVKLGIEFSLMNLTAD